MVGDLVFDVPREKIEFTWRREGLYLVLDQTLGICDVDVLLTVVRGLCARAESLDTVELARGVALGVSAVSISTTGLGCHVT